MYTLKPGDKVAVHEKSKSLEAIERSLSNSSTTRVDHLEQRY
jgi:small subunit ribosomal protein S4